MDKKQKDTISERKADHLEICLSHDIHFRTMSAGFQNIQLMHCALPELNLNDINTQTEFLGKTLSMPLMVTGMTGGFAEAEQINRQLARVCQSRNIALGLGSQRQVVENERYLRSFSAVREEASDIPLIGNIGGAQVRNADGINYVKRILSIVEVDALAIHLNPLQEALQPEGDTDFSGIVAALQQIIENISIPIIVKETGAGISREVALRLREAGVTHIDVSGAGGTSWAGVEYYRGADALLSEKFWDWGIPTVLCLEELRDISQMTIIASGGVRDGLDMAKSIALGADLAGAASPFLKALFHPQEGTLDQVIEQWEKQFRMAMFLTGCKNVAELKSVRYFNKKEFQS